MNEESLMMNNLILSLILSGRKKKHLLKFSKPYFHLDFYAKFNIESSRRIVSTNIDTTKFVWLFVCFLKNDIF